MENRDGKQNIMFGDDEVSKDLLLTFSLLKEYFFLIEIKVILVMIDVARRQTIRIALPFWKNVDILCVLSYHSGFTSCIPCFFSYTSWLHGPLTSALLSS